MQTDVLIAGAGPTGLTLARQLTRFGVDHIVIDKREGTTPHSKAIGVQARTLELYEQIGTAGRLISEGRVADKARLISGGQVKAEIDFGSFGAGMSPFPFLLIIEQGVHERIVYEDLQSVGGGVRWLTEMTGFTPVAEGVSATINSPTGKANILAKYLVGCDGAHSLVRKSLGLKFEGSTFERLFYVADVDIDWDFTHEAFYGNLGENTLTAFFPIKGGDRRWRIVGTFPEGHDKDESDIVFDEIERQVAQDTSLKFDITHVNWFSVYKVHSRAVEAFSSGRCFLAGDSAHIHTPAGAQGMNTGIQDAYNLAWKLAQVLKHGAQASLLETYNEERLPNAKRLLSTTDRLFDYAASDSRLISFLRIHVFPRVANFAIGLKSVRQLVFPIVSQIGINYRESSLSKNEGSFGVKAGDRMPWLTVGGRSIYDDLHAPRFHLLIFSEGIADFPPLRDALSQKWQGRIDSHFYPLDETAKEAFGCSHSFLVILRPDNYIGLLSDNFSSDRVEEYLRKFE
ncbi:MAG: FAD-dependent monooxygenase [bacterium]|nr:FAD-dependent monooxygenase [bacterium]